MIKKQFICLIAAISLLLSFGKATLAYSGNTIVFIDVPSNHWAKTDIDYFAKKGIVNGVGNNRFEPESGVTREEFCKMLALTFDAPKKNPDEPTFSDVPKNRWSYPYVEICRELLTGYVNPFGGKPAFHPTEYAKREDIAVALVKLMGYSADDVRDPDYAKNNFWDSNDISPSLLPYISVACEKGLINGYEDGSFGPMGGITRAETVTLLSRATKQAMTDMDTEYSADAPTLEITACPHATVNPKMTISGRVSDRLDDAKDIIVTVNGKKVTPSPNGNWSTKANLTAGVNKITIVATNSMGISATITKTVNLVVDSLKADGGFAIITKVSIGENYGEEFTKVSYVKGGEEGFVIMTEDSEAVIPGEIAIGNVFLFTANAEKAVLEYAVIAEYDIKEGFTNIATKEFEKGTFGMDATIGTGFLYKKLDSSGSYKTIYVAEDGAKTAAALEIPYSAYKYTYAKVGRSTKIEIGDYMAADTANFYAEQDDKTKATPVLYVVIDGVVSDIYTSGMQVKADLTQVIMD